MNNKVKRVEINTKNGIRYLIFRPIVLKESELDNVENSCGPICISHCPYGYKVCSLLRNPEDSDNENSSFQEFCSNLTDSGGCFLDYYPCEGTLEENLPDFDDIYQKLMKKNHYVKVSEVIDKVCSDTCPLYKEDHSNCKPSNGLCLLQDLLKVSEYNGGK